LHKRIEIFVHIQRVPSPGTGINRYPDNVGAPVIGQDMVVFGGEVSQRGGIGQEKRLVNGHATEHHPLSIAVLYLAANDE